MEAEKYVVEGFEFPNEHEAKNAKSELKGINYVLSNTNMNNPKSVLTLYNRIIDENLFKTPIGIEFLKEIQEMLMASNEIDSSLIKPIPVSSNTINTKNHVKEKPKYKRIMINSIAVNILLIIVIILMYVIIGNSKNVNIINYENRLKEQYSVLETEINTPD